MHFDLDHIPPSKKNSKSIVYVKGRPRIISSKEYLRWEDVNISKFRSKLISYPVILLVIFTANNFRRFDNSNKLESIQDLLVKANTIPDDEWKHIVGTFTLTIYGEQTNTEILLMPAQDFFQMDFTKLQAELKNTLDVLRERH